MHFVLTMSSWKSQLTYQNTLFQMEIIMMYSLSIWLGYGEVQLK